MLLRDDVPRPDIALVQDKLNRIFGVRSFIATFTSLFGVRSFIATFTSLWEQRCLPVSPAGVAFGVLERAEFGDGQVVSRATGEWLYG
jgi:hypothetical protein